MGKILLQWHFKKKQCELMDAMKYHDKCETIREAMEKMNEIIQNQLLETQENKSKSDNLPEGCVPMEIENAIKDFKDMAEKIVMNETDIENSISRFNIDQSNIFKKITSVLQSNDKILRIFISGPGGTGKSFLIETIVAWNKIIRNKETAVTAPTGIAAYNVSGLTIHRLLHLPVEHGCTAKYKELSPAALKQIRQSLENVDLIIIDEISMVSNITLMYIHLRLTEIFNTSECDDGWFGKIHIIVFGDLLQLPPVRENFAFVEVAKKDIEKYIGAINSFNLWTLFEYDELTINMRQKNDNQYNEILSRLRLGFLTDIDINVLQQRTLKFSSTNSLEIMQELCAVYEKLPTDTVCLLPTRNMCDILNDAMLRRIDSEDINLIANDSFKCPKNLQKKVLKMLDEDKDMLVELSA
ncbi:ATP-dependent DNA helicase pfh1-like [Nasonia vitripennis]|uniref:ATP-dependent DNA helicase n=1 Tax=Nasonia vitripennis TaxID=7425 RepID=A0A7M7QKD4_NASVI|nr:ATP-dependent DNA helicase pfh1-like [Nasonia vitripennis]